MDMEEQQPPAKKSRMDGPFSNGESTEIVTQNDGDTRRQKPVQEDNADNYVNNINELKEDLNKMKEENGALREKLRKSEEKSQMAKNELEKIIHQQKNPQKLEALLANVVAILKEQQKEETTKSNQIELSPCFRLLPSETWTEIFGFVPRPQLAELVPQIGDWRFAEKAQYYLHEFGRITLGDLHIRRSTSWINRKGIPIIKLCDDDDYEHEYFGWDFPMADVPIPKNITNFEEIHISYVNKFVLGFLQEFHHSSLLTNLDLCLYKTNVDSDALLQLVPLLTSIEILNLFYMDIEALIQKEYSKAMLTSARILYIYYKLDNDWYSRWLCTPREDGKPRVLILEHFAERSIFAFIEHIKKDFMDSSGTASFFIRLRNFPNANNVQSDSLENSKTSEKLVINGTDQPFRIRTVTIARSPMQANKEFIEEMGKEFDFEYRYIYINVEI